MNVNVKNILDKNLLNYLAFIPEAKARQLAAEDYTAGVQAAAQVYEDQLEIITYNLRDLIELAARESEFYSLHIARQIMRKLGEKV